MVFNKRALLNGLFILLVFPIIFVSLSCFDNGKNPSSITDPDTTEDPIVLPGWSGVFSVSLSELCTDDYCTDINKVVNIIGVVNDGPAPSISWDTVLTSGDCHVIVPQNPICVPPCGLGYKCVAEDSCQAEPDPFDIGDVTVNGLKTTENETSFKMTRTRQYLTGKEFEFPPCEDGGEVTVNAAGVSSVPAFSITAKGITPLVLTNGSIVLEDDKSISLTWEPPRVAGHSRISVEFDISYHGGTKARIVGETNDDGELTVDASLIKELKSYGIAGFPRLKVYRRSIAANPAGNVSLMIVSEVSRYLEIPGVISCGSGGCPDGYTCDPDKRCREIE